MKKYHGFICMDVVFLLRFEWMFWNKEISTEKEEVLFT